MRILVIAILLLLSGAAQAGTSASIVVTVSVEAINVLSVQPDKILWTTNEDGRIIQAQAATLPSGATVHLTTGAVFGDHAAPPEPVGELVLTDSQPRTLVQLQRGAGGCGLHIWLEAGEPMVVPVMVSLATLNRQPLDVETLLVASVESVGSEGIAKALDNLGIITIVDTE